MWISLFYVFPNLHFVHSVNIFMRMKYELTLIEDNRIGVTITEDHKMVGILYFEKAKLSFTNKPLSMGSWACVDAKIEDENIYHEGFTPKQMVGECQEMIKVAGF
jgi:hypothetical protein